MKTLKINDNFKIESDDNNCSLIFTEPRIATKGKNEGKEYIFREEFHYPTINDCFVKYLKLAQKEAKDVAECIEISERIIKEIKSLNFEK